MSQFHPFRLPRIACAAGLIVFMVRWLPAAVPNYLPTRVYARTGITGFQVPSGSSLGSSGVDLNDRGVVVADVNFVGSTGNPGLFYGEWMDGGADGGIVFDASDTIVGDPQLNAAGQVVFGVGFDSDPFLFEPQFNTTLSLNYPLGVSGSSGLSHAGNGRLGARVKFGFTGDAYGTFPQQTSGLPALTLYAVDDGVDASSDFIFLYTPAFSTSGGVGGVARVAAKVSMQAGFDFEEIRLFEADGSSRVVAVETETLPSSPFSEFITNSVSISDNGRMVAFQATDRSGVSGIYRYDDQTMVTDLIAAVGSGLVGAIDIFAPDVNDYGWVTFRGDDTLGSSSVFVGDGSNVVRLSGEGDSLLTDLGVRQLGRRDMDFSQSGAPRINNRGDVAFALQYFDPANAASVADGTLIMLRPAMVTGDFDGDGQFACADIDRLTMAIVAGTHEGALDLNADGLVNHDDLSVWLAEAGAAQLPGQVAYAVADGNLDGRVTVEDFDIWNANRFASTSAWCRGDWNADGAADVSDFHLWNAGRSKSVSTTVPEPATAMPLLVVACWLALLGRRRRTTSAGFQWGTNHDL